MSRVQLSRLAVKDLNSVIDSRGLPPDTRPRVRRSLERLTTFPRIGRELEGKWRGFRFLAGPWPWLLVVYSYDEQADIVTIVGFHDARSSTAATSGRRD